MAINQQDSKIIIKSSTTSGVVPTNGPSSDHTDGTWNTTDLYSGEMMLNLVDNKAWFRSLYYQMGIATINGTAPLAANMVLISDSSGNVTTSSMTATELIAPRVKYITKTILASQILTGNTTPVIIIPSSATTYTVVAAQISVYGGFNRYATNTTVQIMHEGADTAQFELDCLKGSAAANRAYNMPQVTPVIADNAVVVQYVSSTALVFKIKTGNPTAGDTNILLRIAYFDN